MQQTYIHFAVNIKIKQMKNPELRRLQALLTEIEDQMDDIESDELEERVLDLEEEINAGIEQCFEEEVEAFKKLQKRVNAIKKEHDFYMMKKQN